MNRVRAAVALFAAAVALTAGASSATAAPEAGPLALNPVNCSTNPTAIRVNVPYVPYAYCYAGVGSRRVSLTQVGSVESRNWTATVLWRPPGGSLSQTPMASGQILYTQGGFVDTISVP